MITNKEIVLNSIDQVIADYQKIIQRRLFTKRTRTKNKVKVFSSKSPLCQQKDHTKLCHRDTKRGCYFFPGQNGCSKNFPTTFPLRDQRNDLKYLKRRLLFWQNMRKALENTSTALFLKKYRHVLHAVTKDIDVITFSKFIKLKQDILLCLNSDKQ